MLTKNVFDHIYINRDSVCFPANWCRLIPGNNKTVIFCKILLREDNFKPYFERSVSINEQGTIEYSYMNNTIKITEFDLSSHNILYNINELENQINRVNDAIMCEGVKIPKHLLKYKLTTINIDNNGQFRHSSCTLVVNKEIYNKKLSQCRFCRTILSRCQRKKLRSSCNPILKRIHLPCTPSKTEKLSRLFKILSSWLFSLPNNKENFMPKV